MATTVAGPPWRGSRGGRPAAAVSTGVGAPTGAVAAPDPPTSLMLPRAAAARYAVASLGPTISSTSLPRSSATSWADRRDCRAAIVARTVLIGLFVPRDLVRMSRMPASSITARMAPPEITPVPGAAGFIRILAAPHLKRTSCGIVVPTVGTEIMFRLAISTPLRMASGTSRALPSPAPTRPFRSPTTISAENEKRRPPCSTLATRFRLTTRSVTSLRSPYDE